MRSSFELARGRLFGLRKCDRGQATVEAAVLVPVALLLLMIMLQPGIVLYDRMVMTSAANLGLRLLSTRPDSYGAKGYEELIAKQLDPIPKIPIFHEGGSSWEISVVGNESSGEVSVTIRNELQPLPLISFGAGVMGLLNASGNMEIEVAASSDTQPGWVWNSGEGPQTWVGKW